MLTLKFQDSTTRLASAALVPDSVSIADAVREFCDAPPGEEAGLPLSALVSSLHVRLYMASSENCWRVYVAVHAVRLLDLRANQLRRA